MTPNNPRLLVAAVVLVGAGIIAALSIEDAILRYVASVSAVAVGLGVLRRAFRVE